MDREMIDPSNMVEIKIDLTSPKKDQTRPEFVKDTNENYYLFKSYNGKSIVVTEPGSEKKLYKTANNVKYYVSSNNKDLNSQRNGASIETTEPRNENSIAENNDIVKRIKELEEQVSQMKISLIEEQSKNSHLEQSLKEINKKLHKKNKDSKKQANKSNDEELKSKTSVIDKSSDIKKVGGAKKSKNTNKDIVGGDSDDNDDEF